MVHGAWVSAGMGAEKLSDGRTFILFECEPQAIGGFINYLKPYSPAIEVLQVADYLPQMRAYEARDPELLRSLARLDSEARSTAVDQTRRYIEAKTPADALRIWLETESLPGAGIAGTGGAELVRALARAQQLGLPAPALVEKT
jgi:hypothetical protein